MFFNVENIYYNERKLLRLFFIASIPFLKTVFPGHLSNNVSFLINNEFKRSRVFLSLQRADHIVCLMNKM